jgi:formyl-CoA transferase
LDFIDFNDERFASNSLRIKNHEILKSIIEKWTIEHNVKDIVHLMVEHGVPASPIYTVKDVVEDSHVAKDREMVVDMKHPRVGEVKLLGCPVRMSETTTTPIRPAPFLGENTEEVLKELLGLEEEEIRKLLSAC